MGREKGMRVGVVRGGGIEVRRKSGRREGWRSGGRCGGGRMGGGGGMEEWRESGRREQCKREQDREIMRVDYYRDFMKCNIPKRIITSSTATH